MTHIVTYLINPTQAENAGMLEPGHGYPAGKIMSVGSVLGQPGCGVAQIEDSRDPTEFASLYVNDLLNATAVQDTPPGGAG